MGFMGLDDWCQSDMAADFMSNISSVLIREFNKELKNKANEYNTCGIINVGLILEIFNKDACLDEDLIEFISEIFVPKMEEYIQENKDDGFISDYNRILKHAKKLIKYQNIG